MLDVGLVLCQVFITSQASHHIGTVQDLLYIATRIINIFYLLLVVSISSLFCPAQNKTKHTKHPRSTCVLLENFLGAPLVLRDLIISTWEHTYMDIYVRTDYDPTTCCIRIFCVLGQRQGITSEQPMSRMFSVQIAFMAYYIRITCVLCQVSFLHSDNQRGVLHPNTLCTTPGLIFTFG